jgi:hypothetical protein
MAAVLGRAAAMELPAPTTLAPRDALTLASELLERRAFRDALPYLVHAQRERPTVFGWCRVGKLCHELGRERDAVHAYSLALSLEPDNRYAVVGRAAALAVCGDVSLEELVDALGELAPLVRTGDPVPVLWTAVGVLRTAAVVSPHPAVSQAASELRALARQLDNRPSEERRAALQDQLESALTFAGEIQLSSAVAREQLGSRPEPKALSAAQANPNTDSS